MGTTTASLIRDRCLTVIEAIVPFHDIGTPFRRYRNEWGADFRKWALASPQGSFRRFQVRWTGEDDLVDVSNSDIERHYVNLVVIVAYPQTHRYGADAALDRDDVMDQDLASINKAIGLDGAANFTNPVDATYMGAQPKPERADGVDFLVIEQRMMYSRDITAGALVPQLGSNLMVFTYTASGAENVNGFTIALPAARANQYAAIVTCGAVADILVFEVSARTTTTITVIPSAATTAGDVYFVTVEDIT